MEITPAGDVARKLRRKDKAHSAKRRLAAGNSPMEKQIPRLALATPARLRAARNDKG